MKADMEKSTKKTQPVGPPPARVKKSHTPLLKKIGLGLLVLLLGLLGGGVGAWIVTQNIDPRTVISGEVDGNVLQSQSEQDISQVASRVSPSVVSISTNVESARGSVVGQGAGTGVIVSEDGYIMTNNHVIDGATTVSVTTTDGDIYDEVEVIGSDPLNDIAFLKISKPKDLEPATLGDSSTLQIGQNVFAIGNSLGEYKNTVTSGIVSGLNRPVAAASSDGSSAETLTDLVQTDAAINPGNSGGPLVNRAGQVVGINTAVASDAQGIGFAIPINATKGVLAGVLDTGKVERAYIGVRYVEITPAIAKQRNLSVKQGALVLGDRTTSAVVDGGPADEAGIKSEDIITQIGDATVGEDGGITSIIGGYKPGDSVQVTYLRDGEEQTTKLTLAKYDAPEATTSSEQQDTSSQQNTFDPYSLFGF